MHDSLVSWDGVNQVSSSRSSSICSAQDCSALRRTQQQAGLLCYVCDTVVGPQSCAELMQTGSGQECLVSGVGCVRRAGSTS